MKTVAELPAGVEFRALPSLKKYVVSACGLVFSKDHYGHGWHCVRGSGHRKVVILRGPSGRVASTIAMLVAETWVGPRPVGALVQFHDGDRTNVRAANLYWAQQARLKEQPCSSSA